MKNFKLEIGTCKGRPVIFDRSKAENGHGIVLGISGSGKSTWLNKIAISLVKCGLTVIAFDTNYNYDDSQIHPAYLDEFKKYLNSVNVYEDGIKIPLFKPIDYEDGKQEKSFDMVDDITDAFARTFGFKQLQRASLRTAISMIAEDDCLYAKEGIGALYDALVDIDTNKALEVADRISPITEHNVFRDGELFVEQGKINLIRLSEFSEKTQKSIVEIVSAFLWKYASKKKFADEVYIIIDEAQNIDLGKNSMVSKILSEGRKYHYNLLLSTQTMPQNSNIEKQIGQAGIILNFKSPRSESKHIACQIDKKNSDKWTIRLNRLNIGEFIASGSIMYGEKLLKDPIIVKNSIINEIVEDIQTGYQNESENFM